MNYIDKKKKRRGEYALALLADEWLRQQQVNVKRNTHESYVSKVNQIKVYFAGMDIDELTYDNIQSLLNEQYAKGKSKSTIKKYKQMLIGIVTYAIKKGLIEKNPCDLVELPKNAFVGSRRDLTSTEIDILLKSKHCTYSAFALFLYYTGARLSEAIPIKWSDVNYDNNEICFSRVATYAGGKTYIDNFLKNKDKQRVVPIAAPLLNMLNTLPKTCEWIFPNTRGNIMARNTARLRWKEFQEESGLLEVTPHMLRHTFATNMYKAGIDIKTLQKITGHRDIEVLFQKYIHDDLERVRASVTLMNAFYEKEDK